MKLQFFFTFAFLLIVIPVRAQWVQTSAPTQLYTPPGFQIGAIAALGDTIFASAADTGVFVSTDNGAAWNVLPSFPGSGAATLFASGNALVTGAGNMVYISSDRGLTWDSSQVPFDASAESIVALAVSGGNLIVGTGFAGADSTFLSTDNGKTWTSSDSLFDFSCLLTANGIVFAGTFGAVLVSSDNGMHWTQADTNRIGYVLSLISSGENIIAGTANNGLYVQNGSTGWTQDTLGISRSSRVSNLAASGNDVFAGLWYGGVAHSSDNGVTWKECGDTGLGNTDISALLVNNGNVYVGTADGIFVSSDKGSHWSGPFPPNPPSFLIPSPINSLDSVGENVFVCTEAGLFVSTDSGATWQIDSTGIGTNSVRAVVTIGGKLLACTTGGIYASSDDGISWSMWDTERNASNILQDGSLLYIVTSGGVVRSTNGGATWVNPGNSGAQSFSSLAAMRSELIAGAAGQPFFSPDSGKDWYAVLGYPTSSNVNALATIGDLLFGGTNSDGVWLSSDSGIDWREVNNGLSDMNVTSLLVTGTELYAGTNSGWIYRSIDSGAHWSAVTKTFPMNAAVTSLALRNGNLYAATADTGIWRYSYPPSAPSSVAQQPDFLLTITPYPDPSEGFVYLKLSNEISLRSARIFGVTGEELHPSVSIRDGLVTIDARGLLPGSYFAQLVGTSGSTYLERFTREP